MEREILFRGKRLDNSEWIEGFLFYRFDGFFFEWQLNIQKPKTKVSFAIQTKTIGQYTGLNDKNGKKIFEGDIIKAKHYYRGELNDNEFLEKKIRNAYGKNIEDNGLYNEHTYLRNYIVEYSSKKGAWIGRNGSDQHPLISLKNVFHCGEVIGNIYDNPELLEVKEK